MEDDNIEEHVSGSEAIYCYTQAVMDATGLATYHTVFLGPLLNTYIAMEPSILQSHLGGHTISASNEKPMFLIPYDDPHVKKCGKDFQTFTLHVKSPNDASSITIPMLLDITVSRFLQYKLEAGRLYKKANHKWVLHEI